MRRTRRVNYRQTFRIPQRLSGRERRMKSKKPSRLTTASAFPDCGFATAIPGRNRNKRVRREAPHVNPSTAPRWKIASVFCAGHRLTLTSLTEHHALQKRRRVFIKPKLASANLRINKKSSIHVRKTSIPSLEFEFRSLNLKPGTRNYLLLSLKLR